MMPPPLAKAVGTLKYIADKYDIDNCYNGFAMRPNSCANSLPTAENSPALRLSQIM